MPKHAQVTIVGEIHGQETNNVLNFRSELDAGTLADLLNDIGTCIITSLLPALSNEWKYQELRGKITSPVAGDEVIQTAGVQQGSQFAQGDVTFTAALFSVKTGFAGRSKRGRFFIAGVAKEDIINSRFTDAHMTLLVAFATCLINKFILSNSASNWRLGVLSRKTVGGAPINYETAFTPALTIVPAQTVAVMRSRRIGHGR